MTSSLFPDVNVWLALTGETHEHSRPAQIWYGTLISETLLFCRMTQLGFLRILTNKTAMQADVKTNLQALRIYQQWIQTDGARYREEPDNMEAAFASIASTTASSPKLWNDAYLSAFAVTAGLRLVTFDRALARRTSGSILLS
ncbi:TA system VapC family ribonuclease toxin [Terriglobus saanensis]|uniref:Ribonuclease VapC n=1 Tax=Terriglobus saanensis (strain ATCC BAA-1853 / DSM 23119 / SP1PR4) TaxID=401053 RepID=E8V874_TERSS|nr:TA system VapC family ribonuclease toxin [Terriglobus saanensis]ADV84056.1 PIN domain protein family protein [Terriglobus saanensis SP1PR4]